MKKYLSYILALVLVVAMVLPLASCNTTKTGDDTTPADTTADPGTDPSDVTTGPAPFIPEGKTPVVFSGNYTYRDSVSILSSNWNPHTYQTNDESYPIDFIAVGLYSIYFNDALRPVEGKEAYNGYIFVPEMAESMPVDVTEQIKAMEGNPYKIPESATKGYAYTIDLNKNAVWQDGTPINADTYVYSMKQLLDPAMKNYRATDYFANNLSIAFAENYYYQGSTSYSIQNMTAQQLLDSGLTIDQIYINIKDFWNMTTADGKDYVCAADETLHRDPGVAEDDPEAYISGKYLWDNYIGPGASYHGYGADYLATAKEYAADFSFDNVGIFKSGDYQITIVFSKSLAGFNLLYNLSGNWIVYQPYYDACKSQVEGTDAWTTTYNTSVETTMSYGPYKLTQFQSDKSMRFEKNETWYGYSDGVHYYQDPEDGEIYPMYQTTAIDTQVVSEASTRKLMFLKGQLMTYGLQSEDFAEYRISERCYQTPSETLFFFLFNGYMDAIKQRENNEGFDTSKYDLETMTLISFRKAMALTYDKSALCEAVSPARAAGFGLIGNMYIYDPDNCLKYRDSEQAKKVLCDFYSVDVSKYASLDEAVDSITGYDPEGAKLFFTQAFNEAIEKGYITDADNDGKADQTVRIEYSASSVSDFLTKTIDYLNTKLSEVLVGTPFEGKIEFYISAPYGNEWSTKLRDGLSDTALCGWSGSRLDPFSIMDCYTNKERQYDANWFNADATNMTLTINGEELTMSLTNWNLALNGETITVDGKDYNFGDGMADVSVRLDILAGLEGAILQTYNYIPMLQDAGMSLLSYQVYYVVDDYNPILGRGGITYLKYNYTDEEWSAYVASQPDSTLKY